MKRVVKDKYIKELSKFGIIPSEEINISTRIKICKEFTNKIFTTFKRFPISQIQLFMRVYCLKIAYANIKGIRKAFYFYKNNTIYVDKEVLNIELYTRQRDFEQEKAVETVLRSNGLTYSKEAAFIESEAIWQIAYESEVIIND